MAKLASTAEITTSKMKELNQIIRRLEAETMELTTKIEKTIQGLVPESVEDAA